MKKLPENWNNLEKIILNILTASILFNKKGEEILCNCTFENIAKGRCLLKIVKSENEDEKGQVTIFSDKALMEVNILYNKYFFDKTVYWINSKSSRKNKVTVTLSKGLYVNKDGYLHVENNTTIEVLKTEWVIPIT
jgi:hypothetical protein